MTERFGFLIEDVFHIKERGTALVGEIPRDAPVFTSGEVIRIVRNGTTVLTRPATVELHTTRGKAGLLISDVDADVRVGDIVEAE